MLSSLIPFGVATLGAVLLALAFPKTNYAILAPVGTAALFWAWFGVSPKRAFWVGWLAGSVFFGVTFWWFGETAGALIAPFGFVLALGPALGDALFGFAIVGALVAFARARGRAGPLVPLAAAAAFGAGEWLRSEGLGDIAVPFGGIGYTQVDTPLAPLAAFAGEYGLTFVVCAIGAFAAYALRERTPANVRNFVAALALSVAAAIGAWAAWPARTVAPPTYRVAAIQGNIAQTLKFSPGAEREAIRRYTSLTVSAATTHPALVLWPETVIPLALNERSALRASFAALARRLHTELVVGTFESRPEGEYNVLYFFGPDAAPPVVYRKRQLVPFAEHLPFGPLLAGIPWARAVSHISSGNGDGIVSVAGARVAPIVCWESAFGDIAQADVRAGAHILLIATDDAWFGTSAGPYQHAQIARMRALETGRWIVRAASTGISGIIAPNGRYTVASSLNVPAVVTGSVGPPLRTAYDGIGGNALGGAFAAVYCIALVRPRRKRRR